MSEPETVSAPAPVSELDQIRHLIEKLDAKLAAGAEAVARMDQFYQDHGLEAGIGEKILTSPLLSARDREIFRALIAEMESMESRARSFEEQSAQAAPRSVGVRAVGNRYRI